MIKLPEKLLKPLDYIYVLRPSLIFAVWIITLAGFEAGHLFYTRESTWFNLQFNVGLFIKFALITIASGALFIFNQLQDIDTDKENKKCFLISENYVKPAFAFKYGLLLSAVPLLIFIIINWKLGVLLAGLQLVWGYLYNYPPFRWKDLPIMGVIANLLGGLLLFLIGWQISGEIVVDTFYIFVPYLCAWGAVSILTTIPDMSGDQKSDKKTISILLGRKVTIWISALIVGVGFVLGMKQNDPVITHAILLSFPLYIIASISPRQTWVLRTIRFSILFLAIFQLIEYPLFTIALALNYYLSRVYYYSRFDLIYPTFNVDEA